MFNVRVSERLLTACWILTAGSVNDDGPYCACRAAPIAAHVTPFFDRCMNELRICIC
jgi:hypothetical protein